MYLVMENFLPRNLRVEYHLILPNSPTSPLLTTGFKKTNSKIIDFSIQTQNSKSKYPYNKLNHQIISYVLLILSDQVMLLLLLRY